jgi:hypothetical protein
MSSIKAFNHEAPYIRIHFVPHRKHRISSIETKPLMLFKEMGFVHAGKHTKHTCEQESDILILKQVTCVDTTAV